MVSIAVPVKRSLAGAVPLSLVKGDVEAGVARLVAHRDRLHIAAVGGFHADVAGIAVEVDGEILGLAKTVLALQRVGDQLLDLLGFQRAGKPRHRDLLEVAGVDADHLMRPQGGEHLRHRQRSGGAEIRRTIDRDLGRAAGIVDEVADPDDIAGYGDVGAQHRCRDRVVAGLRQGRCGGRGEQGGCKQERAGDHHELPQRNRLEADCSIWSAALITLAFIS